MGSIVLVYTDPKDAPYEEIDEVRVCRLDVDDLFLFACFTMSLFLFLLFSCARPKASSWASLLCLRE